MRRTLQAIVAARLAVRPAAVAWPGDQWWLNSFAAVLVVGSVFHLLTDPARS